MGSVVGRAEIRSGQLVFELRLGRKLTPKPQSKSAAIAVLRR